APPDGPPENLNDEDTVRWLRTATAEGHPYVLPAPGQLRSLDSYPRAWTEDLKTDVELCEARVQRRGMELLGLAQARPEIGLPVVKVVVPGLRHFWPRFAPGRLYDVPVKLGWLTAPLTEEQFNPVPMFL